ncbi:MAG: GNAT family N-acetyltransferase [Candidatus Berkelbacteria bacterium]
MLGQKLIVDQETYLGPIENLEQTTEAFVKWFNDPKIIEHMSVKLGRTTAEETERLQRISGDDSRIDWIIYHNHQLIGCITLKLNESIGEVGYEIGERNCWGKGIATACLKKVMEWVFDNTSLDIRTVEGKCSVNNVGSRKVLEKCGFEQKSIDDNQIVYELEKK